MQLLIIYQLHLKTSKSNSFSSCGGESCTSCKPSTLTSSLRFIKCTSLAACISREELILDRVFQGGYNKSKQECKVLKCQKHHLIKTSFYLTYHECCKMTSSPVLQGQMQFQTKVFVLRVIL